MTFWLLTAAVTFCAFAVMVTIGSIVVAWSAPSLARRFEGYSPAACAAGLFRLRMMPGALAAAVAFAVVLPTFLAYEPRETRRIACRRRCLLPASAPRCCSAAPGAPSRAGAPRAAWSATGVAAGAGSPRSIRRCRCSPSKRRFPTVAVVGVARPALFIAERVLRECPEDEVRAMLHHECAHVTQARQPEAVPDARLPGFRRRGPRSRVGACRGRSRRRRRGRRRSGFCGRTRPGADSRRASGAGAAGAGPRQCVLPRRQHRVARPPAGPAGPDARPPPRRARRRDRDCGRRCRRRLHRRAAPCTGSSKPPFTRCHDPRS